MSDSAGDKSYIKLKINPDPGIVFLLEAMTAEEELGRPFLISLDISSKTAKADLNTLLGGSVTVTLTQKEGPSRYFNGVLTRLSYRGLRGGSYQYRMELRPWIWLLSQTQDCRIFQNKSPWDIITSLFRDAGFSNFTDRRQSQAGGSKLTYCVQYRETTLDFVTRLMEEYGLYYYSEHSDGQHKLLFADDVNSHTSVGAPIPFVFDLTEWRSVTDHIWDWSGDAMIRPGAYTLRDYNFTTPSADLTSTAKKPGSHPYGTSEVYDYPGDYDTAAEGTKIAAVRMQQRALLRQVFGGSSNSRRLGAGAKFTLAKFPQTALNKEYLITRAVCSVSMAEALALTDGELVDTFRCVIEAIAGDVPFRLAPITRVPEIRGPQTAKVVGQSGDEITTDSYGRVKVQFPWDRNGSNDQNSSCWIRVAQVWAGANWGAMFIPRIGQEVVVEFLEGSPDRPLITGRVYNANLMPPYALPANATRSTIKSNSSKGGGGFNELRFEDNKGQEEVFFQAQKDYNVVVLNNQTVEITQNSKTTVKQGNRSVEVSVGNDSLTVTQGDHSITVTAGNSTVTAGQSITLKVGGSSIKLDPTSITLSAPQITVSATGPLKASGATVAVTGQASLNLDGGASAVLKGGIVAIN